MWHWYMTCVYFSKAPLVIHIGMLLFLEIIKYIVTNILIMEILTYPKWEVQRLSHFTIIKLYLKLLKCTAKFTPERLTSFTVLAMGVPNYVYPHQPWVAIIKKKKKSATGGETFLYYSFK